MRQQAHTRRRLLLALALLSQAAALPALAALGEDVSTVESDRLQMKGEVRLVAEAG